jgi:hypothetical protein
MCILHTIYGSVLQLFTMSMIALYVYIKPIGWTYKKVSSFILAYKVHFYKKNKENHNDPAYRKLTKSHISIV